MAKKRKKEDEAIIDVEETYSKAESYFEENKKSISVIAIAIAVILGGYFGYKYLYLQPLEEEASKEMWKAEQYFEQDSFYLALNGDGQYYGFIDIIDKYGVTQAGNLANYYAGVIYLNQGEYELAIEHLESFDSNDEMIGPNATGLIGDATMELGYVDEAIGYYEQAAEQGDNAFISPKYLMKAGKAYESLGKYAEAREAYETIKKEYAESDEGKNIEKYLARVKAWTGTID